MAKRTCRLALVLLVLSWSVPALADSVVIAWDRNPEPDVAGYIVHWGRLSSTYSSHQRVGNITSTSLTGLDPGQTYYFAVQAVNLDGLTSPLSEEITWTVPTGFVFGGTRAPAGDFTGDGHAQPSVFRRSTSTWYIQGRGGVQYGRSGDVPVPADYDGDGVIDMAVWRPSTALWWIVPSSTATTMRVLWGKPGSRDIPVPGDYDGDGLADIAIWRPQTGVWWILQSSQNYAYPAALSIQWGRSGDHLVPADYDGDGATDVAIWRPATATWWILTSGSGFQASQALPIRWGRSTDVPVAADYDGDQRADIAVWRPGDGNWYILPSSQEYSPAALLRYQWGSGARGDVPVQADYDGDGTADLAVWRPGSATWYIKSSSTAYTTSSATQYGNRAAGDIPLLADWSALKRYLGR